MVRIASLDQKGVPEPKWLAHTYGIQWNGNGKLLRGTANVLLIQEERTNQRLVMRLSNPASIGALRLDRAHRFLEYLSGRGVRTPIPLRTCEGKTYAIHQASGKLVEIFPYIDGRSPQIGNLEDTQRVTVALAEFHNAGVFYEDLPDEETCHLYHVALERLKVDVERARVTSVGKIFETLLHEYLADAEVIIASFQKLRPKLVETGLHIDATPNNIILTEDGDVWFIDCNHTVRGRRVFDVAIGVYHMDKTSQVPMGHPQRYEDLDLELESAFLKSYQSACEPEWRDAEAKAYALEHQLMLIHAAAYWAANYPEEDAMQELVGFQNIKDDRRSWRML